MQVGLFDLFTHYTDLQDRKAIATFLNSCVKITRIIKVLFNLNKLINCHGIPTLITLMKIIVNLQIHEQSVH